MQLVELFEKDKEVYNRFVLESQSGSFLQSFEWGEWQVALGRQVFRYQILDNSGRQVLLIQLVKMPLWGNKFYLYAPYGPVLFGGEDFQLLAQELKKQFPDAVFIRLEPKESSLIFNHSSLTKTANIQPGKTLLIDLQKTEDQLLAEMHSKTRYNIKVAQKHGVEIQDDFVLNIGQGFLFKEAIELLVKTAARQGYGGYGKDYYQKMIDFFAIQNNKSQVKLHIYKAVYQNKLLASAIIVDFGNTRTFLFGGSASENKNVMAPFLMHWQAILDAKKQGMSFYDFWGIETSVGETPGFVRFKLGFAPPQGSGSSSGGIVKEYPGAYDYIVNPGWYNFYKIFRSANRVFKKVLSSS